MNLFEYEAKKILKDYGIPVPNGFLIENENDLYKHETPFVLKAQVKYGSRKKQGLIRIVKDMEEAKNFYKYLRDKGFKVYLEEYVEHDEELFLSITCNRENGKISLLASRHGGIDIEEVDEKYIIRRDVSILEEISPFIFREIVRKLNLKSNVLRKVSDIFYKMYKIFLDKDCILVEINPLGIGNDEPIALDAKIIIDDDAYFRQGFKKSDVNFVPLDGNIGCIVNGAGLAMATLDMIISKGGSPANFFDVGGGASKEIIKEAITKVLSNRNVRVLFINILGGITRCDEVAKAIVECLDIINIPLVVRLRGTNEEEGIKILRSKGIIVYKSLEEAVEKAINLSKSFNI